MRARTSRELAGLVADLPRPGARRARLGRSSVGKGMIGAAAILSALLAGAVGLGTGGDDQASPAPESEQFVTCEATGLELPLDLECPVPGKQQRQIQAAAESAEADAERAFGAAENSPGDERVRALADRAEAAAERTRRAVSDAQVIVATSEDQHLERVVLDQPLRSAQLAARDAARGAVEAQASEGEALEEEG